MDTSEDTMRFDNIIALIKSQASPKAVAGMMKFGINTTNTYGVSIPTLRAIAKKFRKRNHVIAQELWSSGIHEARLLASMIDDPNLVTEKQMEKWVNDFNSWDICDQCCSNLFDRTRYAYKKAVEWSSRRNEEYVKRAGFVLMAALAVHDKKAENKIFLEFLDVIKEHCTDERNFVKKAVRINIALVRKLVSARFEPANPGCSLNICTSETLLVHGFEQDMKIESFIRTKYQLTI